jgi:hypothetical protein
VIVEVDQPSSPQAFKPQAPTSQDHIAKFNIDIDMGVRDANDINDIRSKKTAIYVFWLTFSSAEWHPDSSLLVGELDFGLKVSSNDQSLNQRTPQWE